MSVQSTFISPNCFIKRLITDTIGDPFLDQHISVWYNEKEFRYYKFGPKEEELEKDYKEIIESTKKLMENKLAILYIQDKHSCIRDLAKDMVRECQKTK